MNKLVYLAKEILNEKIAESKYKFDKSKSEIDKEEYEKLLEDMKKINYLDTETIRKYSKKTFQKKKFDFCLGIFDNVNEQTTKKIEKEALQTEVYGVGVYSNDIVENIFCTYPLNDIEKRKQKVKNIRGVDFVFTIYANEDDKIRKIIQNEFYNYLNKKN